MSNFITNSSTKTLKNRINNLISKSRELKFLVGFFYFSGIRELYNSLKNNPHVNLKVLVGLQVDIFNYELIETSYSINSKSNADIRQKFYESIKKSFNSEYFDNQDFYEQVNFFIQMIIEDRLIIRKTFEPNHAKLYIFKLEESQIARTELFITGSSNLTYSGLSSQNEFNVEISDYGIEEANQYFDGLWEQAIEITEKEELKKILIQIIKEETLVKEITPFEAYVYVIKSYLDSFEEKNIGEHLSKILEKNGYKPYSYQLDAVKQALTIIEKHNGVIIADVVGLGKTIIACAIARELKKRGVVICPPGLVGDENNRSGWRKYLEEFQLFDWEVRSKGKLEETLEFVKERDDIEVIIVDEAHRFRNQDTRDYELLKNICKHKNVILLTATPFNNKPEDIFSLLKLFIIPKKSTITLTNDLENLFIKYKYDFFQLGYIKRYHNSPDKQKRNRALNYYKKLFSTDSSEIDLSKINRKIHYLAKQIKSIIEPVTIRRNRLDLLNHPSYKKEVKQLSKVADPIEWFYELSEEQSNFYDRVIKEYFAGIEENGKFKGAIYRPFEYEEGRIYELEAEFKSVEKQREFYQQRNLFDFMRRLLVKRFESSFNAFKQSIENFKKVHEDVLKFIKRTGEYILDRQLLEKIYDQDDDTIAQALKDYEEQINKGALPKKHKRYKIKKFKKGKEFIEHIESDINLFSNILQELNNLQLLDNDPKVECLMENIKNSFKKEPNRKIVIFSEYIDTAKYISEKLEDYFPKRILTVAGDLSNTKIEQIYANFDASYKKKKNEFSILVCTDKISEGFNLNRAGLIINYDIPWNPVRVIQRLGRINRISKKVFDEIYIVNFFPSQKGADIVKSREIAQNKMFLIHNTLGEDSKIFDIDEEPNPSSLYSKLNQNPDEIEEASFYTKILNEFILIKKNYPDLVEQIKNFPVRVKVGKNFDKDELLVFFKKNRLYATYTDLENSNLQPIDITIEETIDKIRCNINEKRIPLSDKFWDAYSKSKDFKVARKGYTANSIEAKAINKLRFLLSNNELELSQYKRFINALLEDIIDFGTLADYTIRRISNINTKNIKKTVSDLKDLILELGEDFLEKEKQRLKELKSEIIVAIENIKEG
jgi:ERCC4-related helicase